MPFFSYLILCEHVPFFFLKTPLKKKTPPKNNKTTKHLQIKYSLQYCKCNMLNVNIEYSVQH